MSDCIGKPDENDGEDKSCCLHCQKHLCCRRQHNQNRQSAFKGAVLVQVLGGQIVATWADDEIVFLNALC
jgi:hypothetical protein